MVIGEANAAIRVHDRMPVILGTEAARRWLEPGPLPAENMQAWRVGDHAKSSRIELHASMAEPVLVTWRMSLTLTIEGVEPASEGAMDRDRSPSSVHRA